MSKDTMGFEYIKESINIAKSKGIGEFYYTFPSAGSMDMTRRLSLIMKVDENTLCSTTIPYGHYKSYDILEALKKMRALIATIGREATNKGEAELIGVANSADKLATEIIEHEGRPWGDLVEPGSETVTPQK